MNSLDSKLKITRVLGISSYSFSDGFITQQCLWKIWWWTLNLALGCFLCFYYASSVPKIGHSTELIVFNLSNFFYAFSSTTSPPVLAYQTRRVVDTFNKIQNRRPEFIQSVPAATQHKIHSFHVVLFTLLSYVTITQHMLIFCIVFIRAHFLLELFLAHVHLIKQLYASVNAFLLHPTHEMSVQKFQSLRWYEECVKQHCDVINQAFGWSNFLLHWIIVASWMSLELSIAKWGWKGFTSLAFCASFLWYSLAPIALVQVCSALVTEADKTAKLLHDIFIENDDPAIREEVEIFSLQLLHRKIVFTACGFFNLDFSLLYSMVGVVTTYIVILIQFQSSPSPASTTLSTLTTVANLTM